MKRFLVWLLLLSLLRVVQAQEYKVSELQLQTLETLLQNYKQSNQKAQEQLSALKTKATELQTQVNNLTQQAENLQNLSKMQVEQLQNRQNTITRLNLSLSKLESDLQSEHNLYAEVERDNNKLKLKNQKLVSAIVILSVILVLIIAFIVLYIILKIKGKRYGSA